MENKDWIGGKSSVFKTIGATGHADHPREKHDYYATEPKATEWLCRLETFNKDIWECACGEGHITKVLKDNGYNVLSTDLIDRGYGEVQNFLNPAIREWNGDIITNPPYKYAQ